MSFLTLWSPACSAQVTCFSAGPTPSQSLQWHFQWDFRAGMAASPNPIFLLITPPWQCESPHLVPAEIEASKAWLSFPRNETSQLAAIRLEHLHYSALLASILDGVHPDKYDLCWLALYVHVLVCAGAHVCAFVRQRPALLFWGRVFHCYGVLQVVLAGWSESPRDLSIFASQGGLQEHTTMLVC